jgi:hypothetical protein
LFYENRESRELWQAHVGNQHLKDYMAATDGAVEEFTLNEMATLSWSRHQWCFVNKLLVTRHLSD